MEEAQGVMKLCDQLKNEREALQMVRYKYFKCYAVNGLSLGVTFDLLVNVSNPLEVCYQQW